MLGQHIKIARSASGLTQAELGRRVGRTGPFVAMLEAGRGKPTDRTLAEICDALPSLDRQRMFAELAAARGYHRVPVQGGPRDAELAALAAANPVMTSAEGGRP